MAKIKLGALVVGVRGTVGGVTFSGNGSGNYAKLYADPVNPSTANQTAQRADLSVHAQGWAALTAGQRTAWDAWASDPAQARTDSLGVTYYMSGFAAYVSMGRNLDVVGRAPRAPAPTIAVPAAPTGVTVSVSAGAGASSVAYSAGTFSPDYDLVVEMALARGAGTGVAPVRYRLAGAAQVPGGTSVAITAAVAAAFGTMHAGQRMFWRVYRQNLEGYRSAATAGVSTVGA